MTSARIERIGSTPETPSIAERSSTIRRHPSMIHLIRYHNSKPFLLLKPILFAPHTKTSFEAIHRKTHPKQPKHRTESLLVHPPCLLHIPIAILLRLSNSTVQTPSSALALPSGTNTSMIICLAHTTFPHQTIPSLSSAHNAREDPRLTSRQVEITETLNRPGWLARQACEVGRCDGRIGGDVLARRPMVKRAFVCLRTLVSV